MVSTVRTGSRPCSRSGPGAWSRRSEFRQPNLRLPRAPVGQSGSDGFQLAHPPRKVAGKHQFKVGSQPWTGWPPTGSKGSPTHESSPPGHPQPDPSRSDSRETTSPLPAVDWVVWPKSLADQRPALSVLPQSNACPGRGRSAVCSTTSELTSRPRCSRARHTTSAQGS
jgi:hypothetical protein